MVRATDAGAPDAGAPDAGSLDPGAADAGDGDGGAVQRSGDLTAPPAKLFEAVHREFFDVLQ